jgi:uncharacterized membrane protein YhhN
MDLLWIALLVIAIIVGNWLRKLKYKLAFRFGAIEHLFSRLAFMTILIALFSIISGKTKIAKYALITAVILWIIYWSSHKLEKRFHK